MIAEKALDYIFTGLWEKMLVNLLQKVVDHEEQIAEKHKSSYNAMIFDPKWAENVVKCPRVPVLFPGVAKLSL